MDFENDWSRSLATGNQGPVSTGTTGMTRAINWTVVPHFADKAIVKMH